MYSLWVYIIQALALAWASMGFIVHLKDPTIFYILVWVTELRGQISQNLPDFPEEVKWLTEEERDFLRAKLAKDSGKAGNDADMGWREVLTVFKDRE